MLHIIKNIVIRHSMHVKRLKRNFIENMYLRKRINLCLILMGFHQIFLLYVEVKYKSSNNL